MSRLFVIIPILLLLGAGAAAWWFVIQAPKQPQVVEQPPPPPPEFVELTPMVLPLIQEGKVVQHLTLKVVLEVRAGTVDDITLAERQLTDALFSELHSLLAMRYVREQDDMPGFLGKRLLIVGERLMGRGVILKVLVSELARQQPTQS